MEQKKLSRWLEQLQQESWNLELLISGFSIFLLFQVSPVIDSTQQSVLLEYGENNALAQFILFILIVAKLTVKILLINLVVHVALRGFWIGTIGLRSVQKNINFDEINYSAFFKEKLKNKVGGLDKMVVRLDAICSVIFSFSFLIIFMIISLFLHILFFATVLLICDGLVQSVDGILEDILVVVTIVLVVLILLIGFIYFIDTISLGFFKRFQRLSRWYYPIYRFMSFITLSFVYRSIYYSFINRFSKTKIRLFLIPYLLIVSLSPFFGFEYAIFYPDNATELKLDSSTYNDQRKVGIAIGKASIPSQIVSDDWLPLFIRYTIEDNESILAQCPDYTPSKEEGFVSGIYFNSNGNFRMTSPMTKEDNPKKLLSCLTGFYNIYLNDSIQNKEDFYYYTHPNENEKGIYTVLNIKTLPLGKNNIVIKTKHLDDNEVLNENNYITIPFWKQ